MAIATQSPTQYGSLPIKRRNPVTGQLEDVTTSGAALGNGSSPYQYFKSKTTPVTDASASGLASNLMQGYSKTSYKPKTAQDYIPPEMLAQLGQVTGGLANYKPEKINVGQAQSMPVEYYQSQIEDLSKPLTEQYNLSREKARGDQAARGTMYDSEGYRDIGQLDKSYIDQLGNMTRGVQQQRMQNENQNQQFNITNELNEGLSRRDLGLQGLTSGGNLLSNVSGMFGQLGQGESDLEVRTALQQAGIDANTINSLLGYGADRYGTEANLFGNVYQSDQDFNKGLLQDATNRFGQRIDLLGLPGYTESPQTEAYNNLLYSLGMVSQKPKTQQR